MEITLEQAYAEACRIIGQQTVERSFLSKAAQEAQPEPDMES